MEIRLNICSPFLGDRSPTAQNRDGSAQLRYACQNLLVLLSATGGSEYSMQSIWSNERG